MLPEAPLIADDVRRDLWSALEPVLTEVDSAAEAWPGVVDLENLRILVKPFPLSLELIIAAREGRPARRLAVFSGDKLPDGGKALGEAVEALVGGVLAEQGMTVAEGVAECAAVPGGGIAVVCDPTTGAAGAVLAAPREDLSRALMLGGVGETVTGH
jgi:hypothetical protein